MEEKPPAPRERYPERDKVDDLDRPAVNDDARQQEPRRNEERGNRGPDEQPSFGQGA